ncbi:hypothetical protein COV89_03635 [Candidatus Shapirobacteria bacterium CG11_big_fil_rev_8_21_14_0_20_40_12]|uniref:Helix-turn-helix type 11 domain-containing protein n=2 Tax=Candidatus Shapironibacteriota TaxID=1752721 RepID=A0A2M8ETU9_9BACT|nr:MAG: hypothetical protein COV89_03635 [Candidatus Shapirobacteria bacterium CG11_big_fil_rev_8_21_14_0_20_40_12]PJC28545.1 MAG: hypothetical protein CO053_03950 [Candidatus Shapirobacteria bacterium CG_4_9_14_0_2_um_filter_40_11]
MKKIEIIWRELLYSALEKDERRFEQKDLAAKFGFSTSTVFQALKIPRQMGAVRVTGRYFILEDPEKLLYHWASVHNLENDILASFKVGEPVLDIEAKMPPEVIFGAYSAARMSLTTPPADYDKVYIYTDDIEKIKDRFEVKKGIPNLFILKQDEFLSDYGQKTVTAQTFVDLWNLKDWYAKEYVKAIKEKIDAVLS